MKVKFISNEYIFKDDMGHVMIANMSYVEKVAMIEFKMNNKLLYYYLISENRIDGMSDLDIINEAVEEMENDKCRWIEDKESCQYYIDNSDKFILDQRVTVYRALLDADTNHICTISIVEENDNRFIIRMKDEQLKTMVVTHMDAENRNVLIESMEALYSMILEMIKPFKNREEQIILNEFGKNYVLQKQLKKLHN